MLLAIQIPCFNESLDLPKTLNDLPRSFDGVDEIIVLIVDDGSSDGTSDVAERNGAHFIVRFPRNRGLAEAYLAGIEACFRLGADLIVNTDADNQYCGSNISRLIYPILVGRADIVIGDRRTYAISDFSWTKKVLQHWGSKVVRTAAGVSVADATSGFRALNRRSAKMQIVHNRFTYTLETLIHAGEQGLAVESVSIDVNPPSRASRLFRSIPHYLRMTIPTIIRSYLAYWPGRTLSALACFAFMIGLAGVCRFGIAYVNDPSYNGHIQSLQVGIFALTLAFLCLLLALLSDLLSVNRRLIENVLVRVKEIEAIQLELWKLEPGETRAGVYRTRVDTWKSPTLNGNSPAPVNSSERRVDDPIS